MQAMRVLAWCTVLLALGPSLLVSAARIHGTIYDYSLNMVEDAIVKINTSPRQTFVAKQGSYEFNVEPGTYALNASVVQDSDILSFAEDDIVVNAEGEYVLDMVLFPEIQGEDLNEPELGTTELERMLREQERDGSPGTAIFIISFSVIVFVVLVALVWMGWRKKASKKIGQGSQGRPVPLFGEREDDRILAFIRRERHTTQKDIRKQFPLSEAKISLVLASFEQQGLIRKIKKGRGNIIVYKG